MAKLFLTDYLPAGPGDPFARFLAALTPQEAEEPIAAWIAVKRESLDWTENVCDMVSRHFGLPVKPQWAGEAGNGYAAAAAALAARLGVPGPAAPPAES